MLDTTARTAMSPALLLAGDNRLSRRVGGEVDVVTAHFFGSQEVHAGTQRRSGHQC
jgi:hypothetical protein